MRQLHPAVAVVALLAFPAAVPVAGQDLHPSRRASPIGIARAHLGDTYVKVTYGRPYLRERRIFGSPGDSLKPLVPFGQVWRTGANEATELTTTGPLEMAGHELPAGTYSVFTVPGPASWEIRFSPQLELDGTGRLDPATGQFTPGIYDPARDALRISVPSGTVAEPVDQFTITFEPAEAPTALVLRWERTEVRIPAAPVRDSR